MLKKRLFINMSAGIISFAVNMAIGFFLTPYIVSRLGTEAYGFIGLANNFVNYGSLVTIALNSMAGRFITIKLYENDREGACRYFSSLIIANIAMTVVLLIPSILCIAHINKIINIPPDLIGDAKAVFGLSFVNFFIGLVSSVLGICFFAKNRLDIDSARNIVVNVFKVAFLLSMYAFLPAKILYVPLLAVIISIYILISNLKYNRRLLPELKFNKKHFDIKAIKELFLSGIWNVVTKLSCILSTGLNLLLANIFIGANAMGMLSLSRVIPNVILTFFGMMASIFAPEFTIHYAEKNNVELKKHILLSVKILGMFSSVPIAVLFAYGNDFYSLWLPGQDSRLLQTLTIISCFEFIFVLPIEGLWNVFTVTNKIKAPSLFLFTNGLFTVIIVFIGINMTSSDTWSLFLIAGVSTAFSIIRALTFLPLYGAKVLGFKWSVFYPPMIKNFVSVTLIICASYALKFYFNINNWAVFLSLTVTTGAVAVLLNWFVILSEADRAVLKNKLLTKLKPQSDPLAG